MYQNDEEVKRILDIAQKTRVPVCAYLGVSELALAGGLDGSAKLGGHCLHAVADTEHGYAQLEHRLRRPQPFQGSAMIAARMTTNSGIAYWIALTS